jgi:hypothetical protein
MAETTTRTTRKRTSGALAVADPLEAKPSKPRLSEVVETLNGREVFAIESRHRMTFPDDMSPTRLLVSVAATLHMRDGMAAKDAWNTAELLTLTQLNDMFETEDHLEDTDTAEDAGPKA